MKLAENINKFGIKDIFSVIKKNIVLISSLFFVFLFVFSLTTHKQIVNNKDVIDDSKIYVASIDYYLEPKIELLNNENINFFRAIPDDFVALLNTHACKNYVYDELLSRHNIGDIEQKMLSNTINNSDIATKNIENLYIAKREKNTMVVNLTSVSYDPEICKEILNVCNQYIDFKLKKSINQANIQPSNVIVQLSNPDKILEEYPELNFKFNQNNSKTKTLRIIIKNLILPVFILMFLLIFTLSLFSYFNPTLNRMSDFSEYTIPIIGELNPKNVEKYKYIANSILDIFNTENKKIFVFTTSIHNKYLTRNFNIVNIIIKIQEIISNKNIKISFINNTNLNFSSDMLSKKIDSESQDNDIIFVCIPNILEKSEAFECAKMCKNIILIEKCVKSKYSDYEKVIFYLNQNKISPKGVVILD